MPKILNFTLFVLSLLARLSFALTWFCFLIPICLVVQALKGTVTTNILQNDNFLVVSAHLHLQQTTIEHFPQYLYAGLMSVGAVLAVIGALYGLKALIKILMNIRQRQYFSDENRRLLWTFIVAQFYALAADPFIAGANQLARTYLGRVNTGYFDGTWEDIYADLVALAIIGTIYILFCSATKIKREAELTI